MGSQFNGAGGAEAHQYGSLHLTGRGHLGQLGQRPLRVQHDEEERRGADSPGKQAVINAESSAGMKSFTAGLSVTFTDCRRSHNQHKSAGKTNVKTSIWIKYVKNIQVCLI